MISVVARGRRLGLGSNKSRRTLGVRLACDKLSEVRAFDVYADVPGEFASRFCSRSRVTELVLAGPHSILAVVTEGGLARAYDLVDGRHLGVLNPSKDELVHTVLFNRCNDTLIVVYAPYAGALGCNVYCCWRLKQGRLHTPACAWEFRNVQLTHPAFFEFDETNDRIGVACMETQKFEFWDLGNYRRVFTLRGSPEDRFEEIRVSDSVILFLKAPKNNRIPFTLYDISDGQCLAENWVPVVPARDVIFLELCNEFLLLKQEGSSLRIHDLITNRTCKIAATRNMAPLNFVFYDHPVNPRVCKAYGQPVPRRFFTICSNYIELWVLCDCRAARLKRIHIPNLIESDLVSYSSEGSLLAVCCSIPNLPLARMATVLEHLRLDRSGDFSASGRFPDNFKWLLSPHLSSTMTGVSPTSSPDHSGRKFDRWLLQGRVAGIGGMVASGASATEVRHRGEDEDVIIESPLFGLEPNCEVKAQSIINVYCITDGSLLGAISCPASDKISTVLLAADQFKLVTGLNNGISKIYA